MQYVDLTLFQESIYLKDALHTLQAIDNLETHKDFSLKKLIR